MSLVVCFLTSNVELLPTDSSNLKIFLGCQNRKNTATQMIETTAEAISGNSGPLCTAVKYCTIAKLPPATRATGQVSFTPFSPFIKNTRKNGTKSESGGGRYAQPSQEISVAGTHRPPGHRSDWHTYCTKCHWRSIGYKAEPSCIEWAKPKPHEQRSGNCHRSAKANRPFQKRAKAESLSRNYLGFVDLVAIAMMDSRKIFKIPRFDRELVEKNCCNDDPSNRP